MTETGSTAILEKIRKLLALAEGNANEHERDVAMKFAHELLAKHNLTISEVNDNADKFDTVEIEGDFKLEPWVRSVLRAACTLYYTTFYMSKRYSFFRQTPILVPIFVGMEDNIAVTVAMSYWFIDSIRLESNRLYRDNYQRRSFRLGAAQKLYERALELVEAEQSQEQSKTAGTSLMVIRNNLETANEKHMASLNLSSFRGRSTYIDPDAYNDGEDFANRLPVGRNKSGNAAEKAVGVGR